LNEKEIKLREINKEDHSFIYDTVSNFLKSGLSVTFLKMPSFSEFENTYFLNDYKRYIITNGKNDKMGFVVITKDDEVGYFLSPQHHGKGIAVEAVRMLMKINPRKRYFATIHNENQKSINVIKKIGFKPKGTIYEKIE